MYEFELEADIDEMDEADLRETFSEFLDKHEENVTEHEQLRDELAEFENVDLDELEARASKVDRVKKEFAEKAGEYTNLGTEYAVENFSLEKNIELAAEFDEAQAEDEQSESESEFEEQEEKGKVEGEETVSEFDEQIEKDLDRIFS